MVSQRWTTPSITRITILLGGLFCIILLQGMGFLRPLEDVIFRVMAKAQIPLYAILRHNTPVSQRDDNIPPDVMSALSQLQIENAHLQQLLSETTLLEKQVTFLKEKNWPSVDARVTARATEDLAQILMINRGENDGIQRGAPVMTDNGILVGTIIEIFPHAAKILLTTSHTSLLSGVIQNDAHSLGIIQGQHHLTMKMMYVPQFDAIPSNAMIVTSGSDPHIPQGFLIGFITKIESAPESIFQEATVTPLVDPASITIVSVLTP